MTRQQPISQDRTPVAGAAPKVLYLAHDLDDSAIWRRVAMLEAGGARVTVAGFRRRSGALPGPAIVLARTADARMVQRVGAVLRAAVGLAAALRGIDAPDVVLARNLEMLALAARARRIWPAASLVYEVLDIHRMMLGDGARPRALRAAERRLGRDAQLLLTSSPAFVSGYFVPHGQTPAPIRIVENKCLALDQAPPVPLPAPAAPPLVIGWFGILRCAWSLACLDRLTRAAPGRYRVVLRGKPARDAIPTFDATVAANPDLCFEGAYRNPEDLPEIYGAVHLAWLVDRFDAGANSDWLLPNRLYEGCLHGAVPVALRGTETAAWLGREGIGITVPSDQDAVADTLAGLTPDAVIDNQRAVRAVPESRWIATRDDCRALVAALQTAKAAQ